jgi:hypothetical protein
MLIICMVRYLLLFWTRPNLAGISLAKRWIKLLCAFMLPLSAGVELVAKLGSLLRINNNLACKSKLMLFACISYFRCPSSYFSQLVCNAKLRILLYCEFVFFQCLLLINLHKFESLFSFYHIGLALQLPFHL